MSNSSPPTRCRGFKAFILLLFCFLLLMPMVVQGRRPDLDNGSVMPGDPTGGERLYPDFHGGSSRGGGSSGDTINSTKPGVSPDCKSHIFILCPALSPIRLIINDLIVIEWISRGTAMPLLMGEANK